MIRIDNNGNLFLEINKSKFWFAFDSNSSLSQFCLNFELWFFRHQFTIDKEEARGFFEVFSKYWIAIFINNEKYSISFNINIDRIVEFNLLFCP